MLVEVLLGCNVSYCDHLHAEACQLSQHYSFDAINTITCSMTYRQICNSMEEAGLNAKGTTHTHACHMGAALRRAVHFTPRYVQPDCICFCFLWRQRVQRPLGSVYWSALKMLTNGVWCGKWVACRPTALPGSGLEGALSPSSASWGSQPLDGLWSAAGAKVVRTASWLDPWTVFYIPTSPSLYNLPITTFKGPMKWMKIHFPVLILC